MNFYQTSVFICWWRYLPAWFHNEDEFPTVYHKYGRIYGRKLLRLSNQTSHYCKKCNFFFNLHDMIWREHSGSVVECLTRDWGAAGSSLTGVTALCPWAKHINPSLVLVQPRKTRHCLSERLLMGCKESNQTNKQNQSVMRLKVLWSSLTDSVDEMKNSSRHISRFKPVDTVFHFFSDIALLWNIEQIAPSPW